MAQTLEATLAALALDNGCKVIIEARDANGAAVTGVKVSNVNIYGIDLTADIGAGTNPPLLFVSGAPDAQP